MKSDLKSYLTYPCVESYSLCCLNLAGRFSIRIDGSGLGAMRRNGGSDIKRAGQVRKEAIGEAEGRFSDGTR